MNLAPLVKMAFLDNNGNPLNGGLLFTYIVGTSTKIATYTDASGITPNTNPIVLDFRGEANVWLDPALTYKFTLSPPGDTDPPTKPIWTVDNISSGITLAQLTQAIIGQILYPRTAGEIAAGVTPTNYWYPPGWIFRYQLNTVPGTTDMAQAFQKAIDSADSTYPQVRFTGDCAISVPLLLRTTTTQSLSIIGTGRVSTNLLPLSSNMGAATAQGIVCMIFNQKDNLSLRLQGFRWLTATTPGFTGIFMYAVEGGGADASGQASFSTVVEDFWGAPQSTNGGCFQGGFSNLQTLNCVYESMKTGVWRQLGVGNGDQVHTNITLNACFDSYLWSDDTLTKAMISVVNLHAYQHFRGRLFEVKNVIDLKTDNISLEMNAAQVGDGGLYKCTDCKDLNLGKSVMTIANGTPRGSIGFESINGNTGRIYDQIVNADFGIRISGTGVLDLNFANSSYTGCQYAWQHLSGNASGSMIFSNVKLNNSEYCMLMSAGAPTYSIDFYQGQLMNAGFPNIATGRNVSLSSNGATIRFIETKIGHDDVTATATHMFQLNGTGTVFVQDPYLVGTPPTAFNQGTQALSLDGVDSTMPGMTAFVPSLGGSTTYTVQIGAWRLRNSRVDFTGQITVNAIGTGSASTISGLPFTVGPADCGGFVYQFSGLNATVTSLGLLCTTGTTAFVLKGLTAAAAATATINGMTSSTDIRFTGSYTL